MTRASRIRHRRKKLRRERKAYQREKRRYNAVMGGRPGSKKNSLIGGMCIGSIGFFMLFMGSEAAVFGGILLALGVLMLLLMFMKSRDSEVEDDDEMIDQNQTQNVIVNVVSTPPPSPGNGANRFCQNCGKILSNSAQFCDSCGSRQ